MKLNDKIERYLPLIGTGLLFLGAWLFWALIHPEALSYQEQMQMFLFDKEYLMERIVLPAGVARYVSEFLVQFYNNVYVGALIVALLFAVLQRLTWQLSKKGCKSRGYYWLSFWPTLLLWFFMGDTSAKLTFVIALLMAMVAMVAYPAKKAMWKKAAYLAVVTPLLYWCAGPAVFVFALYLAVEEYEEHNRMFAIAPVLYALVCLLCSIPVTSVPVYRLFYGIAYNLTIIAAPVLQYVVMAFFALMPVLIKELPEIKVEQTSKMAYSGLFSVTFSFTLLIVPLNYSSVEYDVLKYDYMARAQRWDDIISKAEDKNPDTPITVAYLNLALGMKGELSERGMSFYQHGWGGAFPPFNRDYIVSVTLSEICYYVGLVNSSQRFAFEAMEAIPDNNKSTRLMKRLVETNIVNGQYEVARKYLKLLRKTVFYKKWADANLDLLGDEDAINNHPFYGYLRRVRLTEDFLFSDAELDKIMGQLVMHNKENYLAIQYLLILPQLEGNQQKYMMFLNYVQKIMNQVPHAQNDSISNDSIN